MFVIVVSAEADRQTGRQDANVYKCSKHSDLVVGVVGRAVARSSFHLQASHVT